MKKLCLADRWHNVNFRIDVFWKEGCLRNGAAFLFRSTPSLSEGERPRVRFVKDGNKGNFEQTKKQPLIERLFLYKVEFLFLFFFIYFSDIFL